MELDLRALEGLNIPDFVIDPKDEIAIAEALTDDTTGEIKEAPIGEIESYDAFNVEKQDKDIVAEPDDKTVIPAEGETDTTEVDENEEVTVEDALPEGEVSVVRGLAEWAKSEDIFDYTDEEFRDDPNFLKDKINQKAQVEAVELEKKRHEALPQQIHELIENYKEGVPLDNLIYAESRIVEYGNITPEQIKESVELQKSLVIDYLMNNDSDEAEAIAKADKYEDSGILEDEAVTAQKKLLKYQQKYKENLIQENKRIQEVQKAEYEQTINKITETINTANEIIPGVEITKADKEKIINGYLKPDKSKKTELMKMIEKDPMAQLKIAQFFLQLNGDLEKVKVKAKTEEAKKAKKVATTYKETPGLGKLNYSTIAKAVQIAKNQRENKI